MNSSGAPRALADTSKQGRCELPALKSDAGVDLLRRALTSGVMGGGKAAPQEVKGSADINLHIFGIGNQYKADTKFDGMFQKVNVNRGRAMSMAEDTPPI